MLWPDTVFAPPGSPNDSPLEPGLLLEHWAFPATVLKATSHPPGQEIDGIPVSVLSVIVSPPAVAFSSTTTMLPPNPLTVTGPEIVLLTRYTVLYEGYEFPGIASITELFPPPPRMLIGPDTFVVEIWIVDGSVADGAVDGTSRVHVWRAHDERPVALDGHPSGDADRGQTLAEEQAVRSDQDRPTDVERARLHHDA